MVRPDAARAAEAIRKLLAEPGSAGREVTAHLLLGRPRRGAWWTSWANLPGFVQMRSAAGTVYRHQLLPNWEYTSAEMRTEMLEDLDRLALTGEQPKEATR